MQVPGPKEPARTAKCRVSIRRVSSEEREDLVSMVGRCSNLTEEEKDCAVELLDIFLDEPDQDDYIFYAAIDVSGRAVGLVCYGERSLAARVYDLYWIIVDPETRRAGVATGLLDHTLGLLAGTEARMIVAETSGLASYEPARDLYKSAGFVEEARIKEFYKPGDDIIFYVKRL